MRAQKALEDKEKNLENEIKNLENEAKKLENETKKLENEVKEQTKKVAEEQRQLHAWLKDPSPQNKALLDDAQTAVKRADEIVKRADAAVQHQREMVRLAFEARNLAQRARNHQSMPDAADQESAGVFLHDPPLPASLPAGTNGAECAVQACHLLFGLRLGRWVRTVLP